MTLTCKLKSCFLVYFLSIYSISCSADPANTATAKPVAELWLNPGFYSFHFDHDKNLNDNNLGVGAEYRYSPENSIVAGRFNNSDRQISHYAGLYWQPFTLGSLRLGGILGVINGYPKANNGDWIPFILPVASYEYKRIGINLTLIPTFRDIVYGSLTLQLKFKIF